MGDVKHYLRKMDFPEVIPEALRHMQKLWLPDCTTQQGGLMRELCEEFVFSEVDKWGKIRHQRLSPIKELQVIEKLLWYFRQPENDQKLATFQFLFPIEAKIFENRLPVFGKLISLAIATENASVLNYIGSWMQVSACTSPHSAFVAKAVIREHIKARTPNERMRNISSVSPLFCASLITAITNMPFETCPPDHLFTMILEWITKIPSLCFSSFHLKIPMSMNFHPPTTPLPGLMFWCIVWPLHKNIQKSVISCDVNDEKFSQLHLAVLQCMVKASNSHDLSKHEAVPVSTFISISEVLMNTLNAPKDKFETSLDMLAMCLQVALSSNCSHADREKVGKLFMLLCKLPYNRPLKIVLQKWTSLLKPEIPELMDCA